MFSNLLGTLSSLVPKNFIFAAYIPVLAFGFISALLMYANYEPFRTWVAPQIAAPLSITTTVLVMASVVAAYILTTVNDFLREILEGKHFPEQIGAWLRRRQLYRLDACEDDYERARNTLRQLTLEQQTVWIDQLTNAANFGAAASRAIASGTGVNEARVAIKALRRKVNRGEAFDFDVVRRAVNITTTALRTHNVENVPELAELSEDLKYTIDYARKAAAELETRAFTARQTLFGTVAEPTRMGNVAASINSYATTRYGIDLDLFWSRLEYFITGSDDKGYAAVVAAKTQLDFLVSSFWLAFLTTLGWFFALALIGRSVWEFLIVALLGPAICAALYLLAVTNYLSYGQIVRAAIDLNRFDVLDRLQLPRPASIRDEVAIWSALRRLSVRGGREFDLSYKKPKP